MAKDILSCEGDRLNREEEEAIAGEYSFSVSSLWETMRLGILG